VKIVGPDVLGVKLNLEHDGQACVASMTLVRTHYQTEGTVIVELIYADGSHFVDHGTWELKTSDDGPATLCTESDMPESLVVSGDEKKVADQLMELLVQHGGRWGLESYEACS
jgi:hypothetical protein